MKTVKKVSLDQPMFHELIGAFRKLGVDINLEKVNDTPVYIVLMNEKSIEPITIEYDHILEVASQIVAIEMKSYEDPLFKHEEEDLKHRRKQNIKPAKFEVLDQLVGSISHQAAEAMRQELKRSREEDCA